MNTQCKQIEKDFILDSECYDMLINTGMLVRLTTEEKENKNEIKIYTLKEYSLSYNMPILENLGFIIESETYTSKQIEDKTIYLRKYDIADAVKTRWLDVSKNLSNVIANALRGTITNSTLNALSYYANLSKKELTLIKAIAAYENQLIPVLNEHFIAKILTKYSDITKHFVDYFIAKFTPDLSKREPVLPLIEEQITIKLKEIDPNIKAIVYSGYSTDPVMTEYQKYGFKAVLKKPFNVAQLKKTISDTLNCDNDYQL